MKYTITFGAVFAALMLGLCAFGPATARAEVLSIEDHLALEVGSTTEWEGGDYVALNMTKGDSTAWFGVVYGNETHSNSVTIVSAHLRFLGGAEIRNEDGAMMVPATGIPVLTVYIQKLAMLIEFADDGYVDPFTGEYTGAGNGLFDFDGAGGDLENLEFNSIEPVYKMVDLNRSWDISEIEETKTLGTTEKEWTFTLSAQDLEYGTVFENEKEEKVVNVKDNKEDISPKEDDINDEERTVEEVAFQFHLGTVLDEYNVSVPWYVVTMTDGTPIASSEVESRTYTGTSLTTEFKFDHWINGWDYYSKDNLLMLETATAFGTFIPNFVQSWMDVQFINATGENSIGIAELETFTGAEGDVTATDTIPEESTRLAKDSIVFKDNWQKVGEMNWVSNVTVDNEEKEMYFQIHAGQNIDWAGENEDGYIHGIIFLGGYIYPMGNDIFHDPSYVSNALFLDIGVNLSPFGLIGNVVGIFLMTGVVGFVVVASVITLRKNKLPQW